MSKVRIVLTAHAKIPKINSPLCRGSIAPQLRNPARSSKVVVIETVKKLMLLLWCLQCMPYVEIPGISELDWNELFSLFQEKEYERRMQTIFQLQHTPFCPCPFTFRELPLTSDVNETLLNNHFIFANNCCSQRTKWSYNNQWDAWAPPFASTKWR